MTCKPPYKYSGKPKTTEGRKWHSIVQSSCQWPESI